MVTFLTYTLAAVLVLGVLIFVHELGHFLVAKASGVAVLRFSIGFGPRIFGRRVGETEYVLSAIPLGGYVKMLGEDDAEESAALRDPARSFANQPLFKRFAIVFAGPFSNLATSWVCLVFVAAMYGILVPSDDPVVGGLTKGLAAERAGLQANDRVLAVDGQPLASWDQLVERTLKSEGKPMMLRVRRSDQELDITVQPEKQTTRNIFGEEVGEAYRIGIERSAKTEPVPVVEAPWLAAKQVAFYSELIVMSLAKMVQGKISAHEIGGPITIARIAGQRAESGLQSLLEFMAFLGVNLGVLNLLPIPVLDGGHLFFFLAEAVFRRPVAARYRDMAQQVGLVLLVSLMLFAVYNDIYRWIQG
ncbi:MAG: RIP metalloprotease RseP [Candidatus Binatia bacterium]